MKKTKTIPFDWELYNNNREKYKVVTRDGDEVTQLTKFEGIDDFPLIGCCISNGQHKLESWQIDGDFIVIGEYGNDLQLQYEEEVKESWVNLYRSSDGRLFTSLPYINEQIAEEKSSCIKGYIKTINLNDLV